MSISIETETAGRYSEVDRDALHRLVSRVSTANSYVIVHDSDRSDEFAQVAITPGRSPGSKSKYCVEYKNGAGGHYQAMTSVLATAQATLEGWAFHRPGWRSALRWKRLNETIVDVRSACLFEQHTDGWTATLPDFDLTATGPDEDAAYRELRTVLAVTVNSGPPELRERFSQWSGDRLRVVTKAELAEHLERGRLSDEQGRRINEAGRWAWPAGMDLSSGG